MVAMPWWQALLVVAAAQHAYAVQLPPEEEEEEDFDPVLEGRRVTEEEGDPEALAADSPAAFRGISDASGVKARRSAPEDFAARVHAETLEALRDMRRGPAAHHRGLLQESSAADGPNGDAGTPRRDGNVKTSRRGGDVVAELQALRDPGKDAAAVHHSQVSRHRPSFESSSAATVAVAPDRRGSPGPPRGRDGRVAAAPRGALGRGGEGRRDHVALRLGGGRRGFGVSTRPGQGGAVWEVHGAARGRHAAHRTEVWPKPWRGGITGRRSPSGNASLAEDEAEGGYRELAQWATAMGASGAFQAQVKVFQKGPDLEPVRGLAVTAPVEAGEAVLGIPSNLVLRADGLNATSLVLRLAVEQAVDNATALLASPVSESRLAAALVALRRAAEASAAVGVRNRTVNRSVAKLFRSWRLYLQRLPSLEDYRQQVPLLARRSLLEAFDSLPVARRLKEQQQRWAGHLDEARRLGLKPLPGRRSRDLSMDEEWEWAAATVTTRVWNGMGCHILIPIADFINSVSNEERNVDAYFDVTGRGEMISPAPGARRYPYVLRARRRIEAGDEVLLAYAFTSDDWWVQEWGFVPRGNSELFPLEPLDHTSCSKLASLVGSRLTSFDGACEAPKGEPQKSIWCAFARLAFEYCATSPAVISAESAARMKAMAAKVAAVRLAVSTKSAEAAIARAALLKGQEYELHLGELADRLRLLFLAVGGLLLFAALIRQLDGGLDNWKKISKDLEKRWAMVAKMGRKFMTLKKHPR